MVLIIENANETLNPMSRHYDISSTDGAMQGNLLRNSEYYVIAFMWDLNLARYLGTASDILTLDKLIYTVTYGIVILRIDTSYVHVI